MTTPSSQTRWFYKVGDTKHGPVTDELLQKRFATGELSAGTRVWRPGMESWLPARGVPELFPDGMPFQALLGPLSAADAEADQSRRGPVRRWLDARPRIRDLLAVACVVLVLQVLWSVVSWWAFYDQAAHRRRAIYGLVTLDGAPLDNATISFRPASAERFSTGCRVVSGTFGIPQQQGLTAGSYVVRIHKAIPDPSLPPPPAGERDTRPGVENIPARYNSRTELRAEVEERGTCRLRFDLQSR